MICLGIESTAHTLGVGVAEGKKVLSNEKDVFKPRFEGIHPRKAAEHHADVFESVLRAALEKADVKADEVDAVAYSKGPGLGACLRIAVSAARALSLTLGVPVAGVNHCVAHVEIGKIFARFKDPLVVYASGGNTQLIVRDGERYQVLGETIDIGIGNLFDSFARQTGEEWGHGSVVEKKAMGGRYVPLPYIVKGMELSFTGLLTDAVKKLETNQAKDVCFSLQENAFSMLTETAERALALTGKKEVLAVGGVAQNKRFREMLEKMAEPHKARFASPPNEFNADNGAMIAVAGVQMHKAGMLERFSRISASQKFRVDEAKLW